MKAFVGVTGASGTIYGIKLTQELLKKDFEVYLSFSKAGKLVAAEELDLNIKKFSHELLTRFFKNFSKNICYVESDKLNSPPASGSAGIGYYFIAPCSVSTLAHIASGTSLHLIHRAADVALKEKKKLVLLIRETPLSLIHIENMLRAARAGAIILPASPAFYHQPETIDEMISFVVGKCLDVAGIDNDLYRRYL